MPPPPEFAHRGGNVGIVEVFKKVKAEHPAHADRHIAITREVEINLQRVTDYTQPCRRRGTGIHAENGVGDECGYVGDQYLFGKTHDEAAHAFREFLQIAGSVRKFLLYIDVTHDRSGDKLGEQR